MNTIRGPEAAREDFPYADTRAATMLRAALDRASRERQISLRSLAKQLNYKQATVLSHMSYGRIPIPLERATDIARAVELPPDKFLAAAVAQRAPEAEIFWESSATSPGETSAAMHFMTELAELAGGTFDGLNDEQKRVIREVVLDQHPSRRWLAPAELGVILLLRRLRPNLPDTGLNQADLRKIDEVLQGRH